MDDTHTNASSLLEDRLRDHQKQAAHAQRARSTPHRRLTAGRDDVFGSDTEANLYRNSPIAPSSWRAVERDLVPAKRSSGRATPTGSSTGAREDGEKIDKLTKTNFDLKLTIHFQQSKIAELEKRLRDVQQLEANYAEQLEMNEKMMRMLELRDRAVDEAVVRIFDMEQRTQELQQDLLDAKRSRRSSPSMKHVPRHESEQEAVKTPRKAKNDRPLRGSVSPEVSARMAQLALPTEVGTARPSLPAFLIGNEPSTAALRRIFIEGNKVVRPIPSHATLLNEYDDDEVLEDPHDILRSPMLSELSDADFRSIHTASPSMELAEPLQKSPQLEAEVSTERRQARVNKWVSDRAVSPTKQKRPRKSSRRNDSSFQSFEQVLQPASPNGPVHGQDILYRQEQHMPQSTKGGHTPPTTANPVFGQNLFPPTPDTMMTRPSNHSTSSFPHENTLQNALHPHIDHRPQLDIGSNPFSTTHLSKRPSRASGFLPQELDAYDRAADIDMFPRLNYRSDSSDTSPETPRRRRHWNAASLAGTTVIDAESTRANPPRRSSPSPPRFLNGRSVPGGIKPFVARSFNTENMTGDVSTRPHTNPSTDGRSSSSRSSQPAYRSSTSLTQSPSQKHPGQTGIGIPSMPAPGMALAQAATSPTSGHSSDRRTSRTEALKQRFNRFARRNSVTNQVDDAGQTPKSEKRRNSITQRLGLGRTSSTPRAAPMSLNADNISKTDTPVDGVKSPPTFPGPTSNPYSPPRRAKSERYPPSRPMPTSSTSMGSTPARMRGMSPAGVEIDEFGVMRPTPGSNRARQNGKSASSIALEQPATSSFPNRGRDGSVGAKARGVLRSLSRSRGSTAVGTGHLEGRP